MKNIFKYLFPALTVVIVLASCKKEENQIFFEGGTAPVLTASSTAAMVLTPANAANQAVKFSWTNPNYAFTTGVSSQNVTYVLQVDTTGANFTSPTRQEISISNDLQLTYTVKELNQVFAKMNLQENIPHNIEYRIKASLVNGSVPLYSNVIKTTVTPYLDVAVPLPPSGQLYITGNAMASDWTNNPPVSQRFTKLSNTEFTITVPFTPGKQYKFLSTLNQWQPQYGGRDANGGDMGYNMGLPGQSDPDAIPTPDVAGNYKITVNFKTGKYTVVKQ
jgi:starch-binding outer membrane protein SusE/F